MAVTEQEILDALHKVPVERWDAVLSFVQSLDPSGQPVFTGADMLKSGIVGMWADRDDIEDPIEFARGLRRQAENRQRANDAPGH